MSKIDDKTGLFEPTTLTLAAPELALILGKSVAAVRGDITRAPERLPPAIRIPGGGKTLWFRSTVMEWLKRHEDGYDGHVAVAPAPEPVASASPRRGRGRPRKMEVDARAAQRAGGAA